MYDKQDDLSIDIINSPLLDVDFLPYKYMYFAANWVCTIFVAVYSIVSKFKKETNV